MYDYTHIFNPMIQPEHNTDDIIEKIIKNCEQVLANKNNYGELDQLIASHYKNETISNTVLSNSYIKLNIKKLNELMQAYERGYEKQFALEFINHADKKANEYIEKYRGMVEEEGKLANLSSGDKVIILGGGSLPLTALTYARVFNASCTCIDIDQDAIKTSTDLIHNLGLSDKIIIKYGDACNYPVKDFDLILVVCLLPKKPVLKNIFIQFKKAKVIYRSAIGLYKLWYGETNEEELFEYSIVNRVNTHKEFAAESVLVIPK